MVPYNQPQNAFDLLERFLRHDSFVDNELPQLRVKSDSTVAFSVAESIFPVASTSSSIDAVNSGTESVTMVALMAFITGIVCTLLFMRGSRRGYQRVP